MRGRRGTFGTSIDVSGSLATKGDIFDAAAFCVAGVTLSALQARFAWQAWYFRYLHRCQRKLGDDGGPMDADCLLRYLQRCPRKLGDEGGPMDADGLLRGRRGTFIDLRGVFAISCMYVRVRTYVRTYVRR